MLHGRARRGQRRGDDLRGFGRVRDGQHDTPSVLRRHPGRLESIERDDDHVARLGRGQIEAAILPGVERGDEDVAAADLDMGPGKRQARLIDHDAVRRLRPCCQLGRREDHHDCRHEQIPDNR